jgi:hypothetical protein
MCQRSVQILTVKLGLRHFWLFVLFYSLKSGIAKLTLKGSPTLGNLPLY